MAVVVAVVVVAAVAGLMFGEAERVAWCWNVAQQEAVLMKWGGLLGGCCAVKRCSERVGGTETEGVVALAVMSLACWARAPIHLVGWVQAHQVVVVGCVLGKQVVLWVPGWAVGLLLRWVLLVLEMMRQV